MGSCKKNCGEIDQAWLFVLNLLESHSVRTALVIKWDDNFALLWTSSSCQCLEGEYILWWLQHQLYPQFLYPMCFQSTSCVIKMQNNSFCPGVGSIRCMWDCSHVGFLNAEIWLRGWITAIGNTPTWVNVGWESIALKTISAVGLGCVSIQFLKSLWSFDLFVDDAQKVSIETGSGISLQMIFKSIELQISHLKAMQY